MGTFAPLVPPSSRGLRWAGRRPGTQDTGSQSSCGNSTSGCRLNFVSVSPTSDQAPGRRTRALCPLRRHLHGWCTYVEAPDASSLESRGSRRICVLVGLALCPVSGRSRVLCSPDGLGCALQRATAVPKAPAPETQGESVHPSAKVGLHHGKGPPGGQSSVCGCPARTFSRLPGLPHHPGAGRCKAAAVTLCLGWPRLRQGRLCPHWRGAEGLPVFVPTAGGALGVTQYKRRESVHFTLK